MKALSFLTSVVLVLCLAAVASADFTDDWPGTLGSGQGGSWGTATYVTGTRSIQPSNDQFDVYSDNQDWMHGAINLDLGSGTPATDIANAGVFYVEFDLDQVRAGVNKKDDAFFNIFSGQNTTDWPRHWRERYAQRESGSPILHPAGWYKYEFTITSGTWGSDSAVGVSVKAWSDTVMNPAQYGNNWVAFTPNGGTTATFDTTKVVWVGWQAISAPSGGDYAQMRIGDDLPGSTVGLKIYVPEPATIAILGLGSLVLLRRRHA